MKLQKQEIITNTYDDSDELLNKITSITYILYADEGKFLKDTLTGTVISRGHVSLRDKSEVKRYVEIKSI